MTSRQIVYDTLEHRSPARAPRQMWTLPWAEWYYPEEMARLRQDFPPDFGGVDFTLAQPTIAQGDMYRRGEAVDEWGCRFTNIHEGIIGEVKDPLIPAEDEDWDNVDWIHIPVELLSFAEETINAGGRASDKFMMCGCCPRPFEQLQFIRGTENLLMDLMDPPPKMLEFIDRMHTFYCELLEKWARTGVDALGFIDDWGSQRSLLIDPTLWKKMFLPMYRDYINIAHSRGKKIFMHSDGYILDIIPPLAEAGLDAVNSQLFCMGLENMKHLKGKITFWGEMHRQHLLPHGTEANIRQAVRDVYDTLWDNGGCIAQLEFGPGAKPENVAATFDEWNRVSTRG